MRLVPKDKKKKNPERLIVIFLRFLHSFRLLEREAKRKIIAECYLYSIKYKS